ncbi:hypothetical protein [Bifidobacterium sp. ESL0704]|uniref:hypothetical protein n=1 Tax=Bifidobacterium sp. ESL0704 TaxID=2983219 RepID=UPI0023F732D5|nr:hypothetical protein [Bifidobacterium sp. ESL0704]WEV52373.1 hypothetical protein OZX64_05570 [Bifidobacterium sp. ESL0704]
MEQQTEVESDPSKAWVKRWLRYCAKQGIRPWEFDFKRCYTNEEKVSNLQLELQYKYTNLFNNKSKDNKDFHEEVDCISVNNNQEKEYDPIDKQRDCDKRASYIYQVFGWQTDITDSIRGDTMNSFKTTFTRLVAANGTVSWGIDNEKEWGLEYGRPLPRSNEILKSWATNKKDKCEDLLTTFLQNAHNPANNDVKIRVDKETIETLVNDGINKFACWTHTIGNFIVMPAWMNTGRGSYRAAPKDYWDRTVKDIHDFLQSPTHDGSAFKDVINKYYLQPYINRDGTVGEFWKGHLKGSGLPKTIEDFENFYFCVNTLIKARGWWMTKKLCEELEKSDQEFHETAKNFFYKEELDTNKYSIGKNDEERLMYFDEIFQLEKE